MIRLSDIASRLNISTATVSNALTGKGRMSDETRRHILATAEEMGYEIKKPSRNDGGRIVVVTEAVEVSFCGEIIRGFTAAANEAGCFCPIYNLDSLKGGLGRDAVASQLRPLLDDRIACMPEVPGCLIYVSQYPRELPGLLDGYSFPSVGVFCHNAGARVSVNYDDQQGAYLAVSHLIRSGRKNIAMISGPVDSRSVSNRMIGYQKALIDHGMTYHPKLVWIGDWEAESGRQLAKSLLDSGTRPDAIFAQNDAMSIGVIQAALEAGVRIPEELSVLGFDNSVLADISYPRLTSVAPPFHEIGKAAYEAAAMLAAGKHPSEAEILLPCTLALRGTA